MPSHRARPFAQKRSTKSTSQETSSAEIMHHGAETNKANMTHRIDRQTVQSVYCGGKHQSYETCPAKGQTCNFCLKTNHFEKVCRVEKQTNRQVSQTDQDKRNSSEEKYAWSISNSPKNRAAARISPMTTILINNTNASMMIDTGASVNVMDEATYAKIRMPTLVRHRGPRIMPYGGGISLNVLGGCDVTIESKFAIQCHRFHVVKGAHGSLIGFTAAQELGLVNIVNKISSQENTHPGLTKGIGKLKDVQVKVHIDESVRPVAITNRSIPFRMRPKIDDEEQRLLQEDTIEKVPVGEPTPWVSPIVTPPKKDGSIPLCIDMREPNKATIRERHNMPHWMNSYMT